MGTGVAPIHDPSHEVHGEPALVLDLQDTPEEEEERQELDDA